MFSINVFTNKNFISLLLIITLTSFTLVSCGGGSDSSTTGAVEGGKQFVVTTDPINNTTTDAVPVIKVTFSKSIADNVGSNNITIWPLINGTRGPAILPPSNIIAISTTEQSKVLEIKLPDLLGDTALATDTIYLIEIRGIEDYANVPMVGECRWLFAAGIADLSTVVAGNSICNTQFPNNNPGTFDFEFNTARVNENQGSVRLNVNRTAGSDGSVSINYTTSDTTAVAGIPGDYQLTSGTLQFASGESQKSIDINITDDTIFEGNETFNVTLSQASNGARLGTNIINTVTILDNESVQAGSIAFNVSSSDVNEAVIAGVVEVIVTRTSGSEGAVSVVFTTSNGTALAGQDYTANSNTIRFANGDTTPKTLAVTILDDALLEANENFTISLSSPIGATLGNIREHTVTIIDNDTNTSQAGTIEFTVLSSSVNENITGGHAIIQVSRVNGIFGRVTVEFVTKNLTAISDSATTPVGDYTSNLGVITFADGDSTDKEIFVGITNDQILETNETFLVILSNTTGGAMLGSKFEHTVTIIDSNTP